MFLFLYFYFAWYDHRLSHLLTYLLTYLLTPWSRVFLEKLTGFAASQEIPRIFMEPESSLPYSQVSATFPYPEPTPSSLHLLPHLYIILPSTSGSPQWPLPSGFPTRTLCTPLSSPIRATCPAHLILPDFTTRRILGSD